MSELLPGRATREGTGAFRDRFAALPGHFRDPDGLWLSSLGLGTRAGAPGGADDLLYRQALALCLERGVNVIDTALSFRAQQSERCVGAALRRAIAEGRIRREEIFVITKGGVLTVDPFAIRSATDARRYLLETYVHSGLVDPERVVAGDHTLEPAFLRDQIERSRRNLGLETIDLYCIQEPELQLHAFGPTGFREILTRAIETLESAVADGAIAAWGLSTWSGLLIPYTERGHLSVMELFELALEVGGPDHHLRGIQLPYGLGLGDALAEPSQFGSLDPDQARAVSVLEELRDTGTAVFAVAPLVRGRAARGLPDWVRQALQGCKTDAQRCLQFARSTPGIDCALVGMREETHVEENLAVAMQEPTEPEVISELFDRARG
ncbi:MAG: aldo/keto reductase [Myxococcota bacterium]